MLSADTSRGFYSNAKRHTYILDSNIFSSYSHRIK